MVMSVPVCFLFNITGIGIILSVGIVIASAVDANAVARRLAFGKPVDEWAFFPDPNK